MLCNAMFISAASLNAALRFFVSQMSNYIVCDLYFCLLQMSFYGIDIWRRFENLTQVSAFSRWPLKMPAQQKKLALNFIRKCNGCCMLRSSDIGRCKARAADTWTITNTFQPQDVGMRAPRKSYVGAEDMRTISTYLGRKEVRVALPELRDLFMRRVDFSALQLVHWATS